MENLCLQSSGLEAGGSVAAGTRRGWGHCGRLGRGPGGRGQGAGAPCEGPVLSGTGALMPLLSSSLF